MNHKEEAIKRVNEMLYKSPTIQDGISAIDTLYAKQCALLAINREIDLIEKVQEFNTSYSTDVKLDFLLRDLTKVKKEIELL